jgi:hypothetical protein
MHTNTHNSQFYRARCAAARDCVRSFRFSDVGSARARVTRLLGLDIDLAK